MHTLEPFLKWESLYDSNQDKHSPLFQHANSRHFYDNTIYNYYIHPAWDNIGSNTLYLKILFVDYRKHFCVVELLGEWNDAIENDIMKLKRNIIDDMLHQKITYFIFISENVFNFFASDEEYYLEWQDDLETQKGWITFINMPSQTQYEFKKIAFLANLYLIENPKWRTLSPLHLFNFVKKNIES